MQIVEKSITRDETGAIVGVRDIVTEAPDLARRAADTAKAKMTAAVGEAVAANQRGDGAAVQAAAETALDWRLVELVARGQHPGSVQVDDAGNVIGCTVDDRPRMVIDVGA